MNVTIRSISLSALAAITTALAMHAHAAEVRSGVPQVTVSYGDLNLDQPTAAVILYKRIADAAAKVCPEAEPNSLHARAHQKSCIARAIARAVASVGAPELTRYSSARTRTNPDNASLAAAGQ